MALYTLIALTAALTGGSAQDPTLDLQIAAPVLTDAEIAPQIVPIHNTASQGSKVTVQFRNAKASEVLEWMEKRGVNFVVSDNDVKADARVTLSVNEVPLESVLDSLAAALGGHWERRDKMRIFHKGPGFAFTSGTREFGPALPRAPMSLTVPAAPLMKLEGKAFDGKEFDKNFEKRMKDMAAEMEKKFGPEFEKKMREHAKEFRAFNFEDRKLREVPRKEFEETRQRAHSDRKEELKSIEKERVELRKMAEKVRAEGRKIAEGARKMGAEAHRDAERARADGQRSKVDAERARVDVLRHYGGDSESSVYRFSAPGREGRRTFITPSFPVDGMELGKFLKSLSSTQKDTQEKRGFIRYGDLTREQKRLLGVRPDGKFEIRLKVNQEEVVVKGE